MGSYRSPSGMFIGGSSGLGRYGRTTMFSHQLVITSIMCSLPPMCHHVTYHHRTRMPTTGMTQRSLTLRLTSTPAHSIAIGIRRRPCPQRRAWHWPADGLGPPPVVVWCDDERQHEPERVRPHKSAMPTPSMSSIMCSLPSHVPPCPHAITASIRVSARMLWIADPQALLHVCSLYCCRTVTAPLFAVPGVGSPCPCTRSALHHLRPPPPPWAAARTSEGTFTCSHHVIRPFLHHQRELTLLPRATRVRDARSYHDLYESLTLRARPTPAHPTAHHPDASLEPRVALHIRLLVIHH